MKPGQKSETPAQGLTQFQLQGDAADRYERWVVPFVIGPWAAGLVDLAGLRRGHRVLDVATGTGVVARLAARQVAPGGDGDGARSQRRHAHGCSATSASTRADELRGLLETAGFHDVIVHHVRMMLRLPVPEEFLLRHLSAMPVAELVAAAGEEGRAALIAHMTEAMSPYVDGHGVVVPQEINVATGLV
jgi:hypothetical protein